MINTKYSTEITARKAGKYLKVYEGKTRVPLLACLHPDTGEKTFRMSLLQIFLLFLTNQAACIYLRWYRFLLFWEFTFIIHFIA